MTVTTKQQKTTPVNSLQAGLRPGNEALAAPRSIIKDFSFIGVPAHAGNKKIKKVAQVNACIYICKQMLA